MPLGEIPLKPKLRKPRSHRLASRENSSAARWLPNYFWPAVTRPAPRGMVHLIFALADHFEPGIMPEDGRARAPYDVQECRLDTWCREYPRLVENFRDHEGRPFCHSYFYPAEQYNKPLVERLASHCHQGWAKSRFIFITARNSRIRLKTRTANSSNFAMLSLGSTAV